jgi:lipopolysaccharide export system ATP-binding protein
MMARRFNRKHRIGNKIPAHAALARRRFHDSLRPDMQISRQLAGADSIMADTEVMEQQEQQREQSGGPVLRGLSVDGIGKKYDKRVVLRDVSLSVRRGEVVGLLGPNGAGKTTCFYSIMGLAMPDSGRILLDGHDITGLPMYRRAVLGLGYLPQETSIFRGMTVEQNIMAVLEVAEPDAKARAARLEELLGEFNITRLRAAPAMALSGGERRRVEIARALAANPSIMLLDEPFAGIDPISIADIRALVVQLRARDIGVLITDHNVRETLEIVNRACIIYDGRVLFEGTPEALVADETVRRVYLGEDFSL